MLHARRSIGALAALTLPWMMIWYSQPCFGIHINAGNNLR
jgi:hypothetical protein